MILDAKLIETLLEHTWPGNVRELENLIIKALEKTGWNKSKAAKRLDIPRHVLIHRLRKDDIEEPDYFKK